MMTRSRLGRAGLIMLCALICLALAAPLIAPYDPYTPTGRPFEAPSFSHWLGTNDVGHDLASEIIYGARASLTVGILTALLVTFLGTAAALVGGYCRGRPDFALMRVVDCALSIPFLPLAIVISVFLGPGIGMEILVLSAILWARPARELRAQVLSVRERGHVQAARAMGAGNFWIMTRHVFPVIFPLVVPQFVRAANRAIFYESSLSFLGLGDPVYKSWAVTLFYANARGAFLTDAWLWWILPPGLCIAGTILSFAFIGHALSDGAHSADAPHRRSSKDRPMPSSSEDHPDGKCLLSVKNLVTVFDTARGEFQAVDGVTFDVNRNEVLGIVGPSGSGKTMLAMSILHLVRPPGRIVEGRIVLEGTDLLGLTASELRPIRGGRVSLIPQNAMNALNPVIPIVEQVAEAMMVHRPLSRPESRRQALGLLEQVGISASQAEDFPHELSGGMRRRVVIAMALANNPALVVADEPTSGLDSVTRREIISLLNDLRKRHGTSLILISHDVRLVRQVADTVAVMVSGKIVERGPCSKLAGSASPTPQVPMSPTSAGSAPSEKPSAPVVAEGNAALLKVNNLTRIFVSDRMWPGRAERRTLNGVSFEVKQGESVGIVGRSGAGKTTIARIIMGLIRPTAGRIFFEGRDVTDLNHGARRTLLGRMHMIFQDPYDALHPGMRVEDIVGEPVVIHGATGDLGPQDRRRRVTEALEDVGLTPVDQFRRRFPSQLSGGQRQRVALARAIVLRPSLIIADEPTSMLDSASGAEILALMRDLQSRHRMSYLLITHDLALARAFCGRLIVLDRGEIVEAGPTEQVIQTTRHPVTRELVRAAE
ncbi:nickel ABC transporter ATP-binding protein NikE [bacterium]|nr:nickel ABC transporter ATP-binding protein NikE [bacterium]